MAASRLDKLGPDLSAYLDGELPEQRTREIEQLLASSPECRRALEQLREASDQLASLPRRRAPDELTTAMRRYAERRELLDQARPAGGERVLRLFVRLTAAAAVLVGCVFVGWQVVDRSRPQPGHEIATEHVSRDAKMEEGVPIAARGPQPAVNGFEKDLSLHQHLSTVDLDGDGALDLATPAESPEATIVALAEPGDPDVATLAFEAESTGSVAAGIAVAQPESTAVPSAVQSGAGYEIAQAGAADGLSDGPSVDVWVTPQSTEQFAAAYTFLVARSADQLPEDRAVKGLFQSNQAGSEPPPSRGVQVVHYIPAAEVTTLIADLERQVPQQVYFELRSKGSDMSLLHELGRIPAEPDAEDLDAQDKEKRSEPSAGVGLAGGRGGDAPSAGARGRRSEPARTRSGKGERPAREVRPTAAGQPESPRRGGRGAQTPEAKKLARSRGDVGSAAVAAPAEKRTPATSQSTDRIRRVTTPPGARKHARQAAEAITVRVRLLPPPASAATQPATSPTSQPSSGP